MNKKGALDGRQLPSKENTLFRSIVKFYETKQYKKGLKAADQILKKFPEHGETLSMKGLTLNCMGKKEEAFEFVREGLRHDLKSHVCWHVFGLLYRSDHNYPEAIKCYRNALRIDPQNLQILRDLYLLQVQTRDLKGYCETRRAFLSLKSNSRNDWIGFAISHHLLKNYELAVDIIDKYIDTLDSHRKATYEESEMMLYRNLIVYEQGDLQKAYDDLLACKSRVVDKVFWKERCAMYLVELKRYEEALEIYEYLISLNPEEYQYHRGIQCCLLKDNTHIHLEKCVLPSNKINSSDDVQVLVQYYDAKDSVAERKCYVWQRILLDCTFGGDFKRRLGKYMGTQLLGGVPSLGSDLKQLYQDSSKVAIIEEVLLAFLKELEAHGKLPKDLDVDTSKDSPMTLLWTMYLSAQHFDRIGKYDVALQFIDKCIQHTPTILDFSQRKGRILKHCGDLNAAADLVNEARKLDLADRYINNKCTEYFLQADRIPEAEATVALFTRHEGDPQQNLYDMQCMWYEIDCGRSHLRQKQYGKALKKFLAVEAHFKDFQDDQFDFHTYSIRKMTLRAYAQLLNFTDRMCSHKFFVKAAHGAIQCYLSLHDQAAHAAAVDAQLNDSTLSAAEKKKAKRAQLKMRKAEFKKKEEEERLRAEKEAEEKELAKGDNNKRKTQSSKVTVDDDPLGVKLAEKDPLPEAWRFVKLLQQYRDHDIWTHLFVFEVAIRKEKYLLALQAIKKALQIDASNPALMSRIVDFFLSFEGKKDGLNHLVASAVENERSSLLQGDSLMSYIQRFMKENDASITARIASASAMFKVDASLKKKAMDQLTRTDGPTVGLNDCMEACRQLLDVFQMDDVAAKYKESVAKRFPMSSFFGSGYSTPLKSVDSCPI